MFYKKYTKFGKICEMKKSDILWKPSKDKNYEEWWYFDALSKNLSMSGRFKISGDPLILDVRFRIVDTKGNKIIIYERSPHFKIPKNSFDLIIGNNFVRSANSHYVLHLESDNNILDLKYFPEVESYKPNQTAKLYFSNKKFMAWVVPVPRAKVIGTVKLKSKIFNFVGNGYSEHFWSNAKFYKYISKWFWGRLYTKYLTIIFAEIETKVGEKVKPLIIAKGNKIVFSTSENIWELNKRRFLRYREVKYPTIYDLRLSKPIKLDLCFKVKKFQEGYCLLEKSPLNFLIKTFVTNPYHMKFLSDADGTLVLKNKKYRFHGSILHEIRIIEPMIRLKC